MLSATKIYLTITIEINDASVDHNLILFFFFRLFCISGDIMVFFAGRYDIEKVEEYLTDYKALRNLDVQSKVVQIIQRSRLYVLTAHSELPRWIIDRIFKPAPPGLTKIILATNVAESSVTVEGLRYVVDTGFHNELMYDGRTGKLLLEKAVGRSAFY